MSEILADIQQFFDIEGELRQSQQNLLELEGMIRASSALAREFGSQIVQERQAHNALVDKFNWAYRATFGSVPQGLQGGQILVAIGVVAILGFIAADLVFRFREQNRLGQEMAARQTEGQAAILAEQNRAALEQAARQKDREATDAQARGDFEGARRKADEATALRRQEGTPGAQTPPPGAPITSDLEKFASENWPWLLLAGGGVVFLVSRF